MPKSSSTPRKEASNPKSLCGANTTGDSVPAKNTCTWANGLANGNYERYTSSSVVISSHGAFQKLRCEAPLRPPPLPWFSCAVFLLFPTFPCPISRTTLAHGLRLLPLTSTVLIATIIRGNWRPVSRPKRSVMARQGKRSRPYSVVRILP